MLAITQPKTEFSFPLSLAHSTLYLYLSALNKPLVSFSIILRATSLLLLVSLLNLLQFLLLHLYHPVQLLVICFFLLFVFIYLSICIHNVWSMIFSCCICMLIVQMLSLTDIIISLLLVVPSSLKTISYPRIVIFSSFSICVSATHIVMGFVSSVVSVSNSTFDLVLLII